MNKIHPNTKKKIKADAIDRYEQEHHLGNYAPTLKKPDQSINAGVDLTKEIINERPPHEKFNKAVWEAEEVAQVSLMETTKEGTRQDLELVLHYLRIARRYAKKAYTI